MQRLSFLTRTLGLYLTPSLRPIPDYHTQFHRLNQTCNWAHTLLYFDGQHRLHTHDYQQGDSNWPDSHAAMVYPLAANKQFYARAYSNCWSTWSTGVIHTHFFAVYVGALPA